MIILLLFYMELMYKGIRNHHFHPQMQVFNDQGINIVVGQEEFIRWVIIFDIFERMLQDNHSQIRY